MRSLGHALITAALARPADFDRNQPVIAKTIDKLWKTSVYLPLQMLRKKLQASHAIIDFMNSRRKWMTTK